MTTHSVIIDGSLRAHLAAAVGQLSSSSPYSVEHVVQDVRATPGGERLFQDYRGDLSGRFLDAVAVAHAEGLSVDDTKAAEVLREVLACQAADGFFGPPTPTLHVDHGAAWGHGRLLEGLLSARGWAPPELRAGVEHATARLANGIVTRADAWAAWVAAHAGQKFHLDPLSAVVPLARYAEETGEKSALNAAHALLRALPSDTEAHMHGYLLALRGQLEVGRMLGDDGLIDDVVLRSDAVADRHLLPHGSVLESLAWPWDVNTEGCGIADWVMLNLRLHELLGDQRHLDRATVATFNALLHAQRASGHFGCETLSDADGLLVSDYAPEAWWCCTFHCIRALHTVAEHAVRITDEEVRVLLPVGTTTTDGAGEAVVTVAGDYPYADTIRLTVGDAMPRHGRLRLRVPTTATLASVIVDGRAVEADTADGWLTVEDLRPGVAVELTLQQHTWFHIDGQVHLPPFENSTGDAPDLSSSRCAVFHGPLLLAAHSADNSLEDLLRAKYVVHEPLLHELARDPEGNVSANVTGHDTFNKDLVLAPMAGSDRHRNGQPVRAWYSGLLYSHRKLHW